MYFFDGIDDASDDLFRVRGAEGGVGAVDGGLDYGVGVFDCLDEGGVRGSIALGNAEAGVVAQLGRQLGGVAEKGGNEVLLAETCCEGGRADSAWSRLVSGYLSECEEESVPAAPMIRIFMDVVVKRVQLIDMAIRAINPLVMKTQGTVEACVKLDP